MGESAQDAGRVALRSEEPGLDEWVFAVRAGGTIFDVSLWPLESEWECECVAEDGGCAHAVAALLALRAGPDELPQAETPPHLVFKLSTAAQGRIRFATAVRSGEGELRDWDGSPIRGLQIDQLTSRILRLARGWPTDLVPPHHHSYLLTALRIAEEVHLDGRPITGSSVPLDVMAVVERYGTGFRVRLSDPPEVTESFDGDPPLVIADDVLRPRGWGKLSMLQRHQLRDTLVFDEWELPRLTSEWLPALAKAIRVEREAGVPEPRIGELELRLELRHEPGRVEILARIVYGDPPVAELRGDVLVPLGGARLLPPRDRRREWELVKQLDRELGLNPGRRLHLSGQGAALWLDAKLPGFTGTVIGRDIATSYRLRPTTLEPNIWWDEKEGLRIHFTDGEALVTADRAIGAWRRGERLVPVAGDGGWIELPLDWLERYGHRIEMLLDYSRDGKPPAHMAPLTAELLAAAGAPAPPDLRPLVEALREGGGIPDTPLPDGLEAELRDYQAEGYRRLRFFAEQGLGTVLADDMGLGKTVQALSVILALKDGGPSLVVAPTSVLRNWRDESARFTPGLRTVVLHGPHRAKEMAKIRDGEIDLAITSYALLRRDLEALQEVAWRFVILDEAQAIKNPSSQTARAARAMPSDMRMALTGTPIENKLAELWSLMEFLNPGFFGPRKRFEERLAGPASSGDPHALRVLRDRIRPFILRRLKSEVASELPPRTEIVLRCTLSDDQKEAYEAIRIAALEGLELPPEKGGGRRRLQVLEALTRLRQAACHSGLLPGGDPDSASGKLDVLMEMLEQSSEEGHRSLVFSQWTSLLDLVEPRLHRAGLAFVRLDGSTRKRGDVVDAFQAADGPPVMLLSLKAGGVGLNLTAADHVFHLDPWWNPAVEQQAVDRAHRIGQTRPVIAWKLVSEGTVEERVIEMQKRKKAMADAVLSGAEGGSRVTVQEMEALLADSASPL
jgi:superfamily II DNA or RNA helicase